MGIFYIKYYFEIYNYIHILLIIPILIIEAQNNQNRFVTEL